eukprot:TRINITY_DN3664_c0_g1_i1.p1 TRINITY_DN3664_c0_g1~~TRINITY_DN3664_c0_g1_i1.p1  ORF type:complete len:783 (-),score=179.80 TRINITY_DN3664_c0_g1_i1:42-2390(-)
MSDIVTSKLKTLSRPIMNPRHEEPRGHIILHAEEVNASFNYTVRILFSGKNIEKSSFFGSLDTYLSVSRSTEGGDYVTVAKTEVIKGNQNPNWRAFTISAQKLCNGDMKRPLKVQCLDANKSGPSALIGEFVTDLEVLRAAKRRDYDLIHPEHKRKRKGYINSGTIHLNSCEMVKEYSFLDYVVGGCDINLIVAIDFTASNNPPTDPSSLHHMNMNNPNEYVRVIRSVGSILADYDSDRLFPVFGFGAKLPPNWQVSHCFPLNGNYANPEIAEIEGIVQTYYRTLTSVQLYGPTIFSEVVSYAGNLASNNCTQENQKYFILLIITDGVITDMDATVDAIVKASSSALSIIIVGVGSADFGHMRTLDADDEPLKASWGEYMRRDIVQFVPYRKYMNDPERLAKETLEEVPKQFISYMKSRGYFPNAPTGLNRVEQTITTTTTTSLPPQVTVVQSVQPIQPLQPSQSIHLAPTQSTIQPQMQPPIQPQMQPPMQPPTQIQPPMQIPITQVQPPMQPAMQPPTTQIQPPIQIPIHPLQNPPILNSGQQQPPQYNGVQPSPSQPGYGQPPMQPMPNIQPPPPQIPNAGPQYQVGPSSQPGQPFGTLGRTHSVSAPPNTNYNQPVSGYQPPLQQQPPYMSTPVPQLSSNPPIPPYMNSAPQPKSVIPGPPPPSSQPHHYSNPDTVPKYPYPTNNNYGSNPYPSNNNYGSNPYPTAPQPSSPRQYYPEPTGPYPQPTGQYGQTVYSTSPYNSSSGVAPPQNNSNNGYPGTYSQTGVPPPTSHYQPQYQ